MHLRKFAIISIYFVVVILCLVTENATGQINAVSPKNSRSFSVYNKVDKRYEAAISLKIQTKDSIFVVPKFADLGFVHPDNYLSETDSNRIIIVEFENRIFKIHQLFKYINKSELILSFERKRKYKIGKFYFCTTIFREELSGIECFDFFECKGKNEFGKDLFENDEVFALDSIRKLIDESRKVREFEENLSRKEGVKIPLTFSIPTFYNKNYFTLRKGYHKGLKAEEIFFSFESKLVFRFYHKTGLLYFYDEKSKKEISFDEWSRL